jgi:hypothetical protein
MALRLVVPLFYCGILKFVLQRLNAVYGLSYSNMLGRLVDYCRAGRVKSHAPVRSVFLHYLNAWNSGEFAEAHYGTLMKIILQKVEAAESLIAELFSVAAAGVCGENDEDVIGWIAYQNLLVRAMAQAVFGVADQIQTDLPASLLRACEPRLVADDLDGNRRLSIRADYLSLPFDEFSSRILFGSIDTLRIFVPDERNSHALESVHASAIMPGLSSGSVSAAK